ncbi:MAG: ATP-dependent DNA ligase [Actinomycetota bacterium]|nr:ATP-dependent DNA ligase [Actinomycetota bacterium]
MRHPFSPPVAPMEARTREGWPQGPYAYEPKWDGFRCLIWSADGGQPRLDSRNQKPLLRYFPELEAAARALPEGTVVDGEVVVVRDGRLDFDALSERIHPADSRIRTLSQETPAELVAFDVLATRGRDVRSAPFQERRDALEALSAVLDPPWHMTPSTADPVIGRRWFDEFESAGCDGIVAKRLDGPYVEGKRDMIKIKHRRTIDCVVGGYRVHKNGPGAGVGSLLLGLYDAAGEMHFVGHCSNFSDQERVALYERLQPLRVATGGPFGQDARRPGEPSRWTGDKDLSWVALEPQLVCEVSYGQLTAGRFRHATRFERWRPDKDPRACTMDQLERPEGPNFHDIVIG